MNTPDVSVIIVGYNTAQLLEPCLRSVYAESPALHLEVLVVDNASTDGSAAMVRKQFPQAQVIANTENVGFARANNQALSCASGNYLLLLNPDTVILDHAIEQLLAYMHANPRVGMCAPRLVYPDMRDQQNAYPFPSLRGALALYTGLYGRFPALGRLIAPQWMPSPEEATRRVDWCSAACLLVSRPCFESIGLLDESFFLYYEDTDWCRCAAAHGWEVALNTGARVIHYLGGSQAGEHGEYRRRIRELNGALHYLRKWHGDGYAHAYRLLVRMCGLYRLIRRRTTGTLPERDYYHALAFGHEHR